MIGKYTASSVKQQFSNAVIAQAWEDPTFAHSLKMDKSGTLSAFAQTYGYPELVVTSLEGFEMPSNPVGDLDAEHTLILSSGLSAQIREPWEPRPSTNACPSGDATVCFTISCSAGCPTSACSVSCAPNTAMGCTPTHWCGPTDIGGY